MAAEDKKSAMMNGNVCSNGCACRGRHWTFYILRVLITVIILIVVFWFGLVVGRMSSWYQHGPYMMGQGYGHDDMGGMMMPANTTGTSATNGY